MASLFPWYTQKKIYCFKFYWLKLSLSSADEKTNVKGNGNWWIIDLRTRVLYGNIHEIRTPFQLFFSLSLKEIKLGQCSMQHKSFFLLWPKFLTWIVPYDAPTLQNLILKAFCILYVHSAMYKKHTAITMFTIFRRKRITVRINFEAVRKLYKCPRERTKKFFYRKFLPFDLVKVHLDQGYTITLP